jgi:hypothetical protein
MNSTRIPLTAATEYIDEIVADGGIDVGFSSSLLIREAETATDQASQLTQAMRLINSLVDIIWKARIKVSGQHAQDLIEALRLLRGTREAR